MDTLGRPTGSAMLKTWVRYVLHVNYLVTDHILRARIYCATSFISAAKYYIRDLASTKFETKYYI